MSPRKLYNNAFQRPDGKVQSMGGNDYNNDHGSSDVITIGVDSVPGYNTLLDIR